MRKILIGLVMAAMVGTTLTQNAKADTADATCEVRKDGDKQKGKSGPCTFGQRQGYIDIDLKNGDTISLSPVGNGPGKYKDQNGNKVTRTSATSSGMDFKWENGKKLTVTYVSSGGSHGYVAPAATASGMSTQRENAEWQRGFNDGLEGRYDQDNHPQPYKDGVRAGEEAAAKNAGGGGGGRQWQAFHQRTRQRWVRGRLEGPELLHQLQREWPLNEREPGLQRQADPSLRRDRARPHALIRGRLVCSASLVLTAGLPARHTSAALA